MNPIDSVCYGCVGAGLGGCNSCCNSVSEKFKECAEKLGYIEQIKKYIEQVD